jgi:1-deoxyxylulose-5-phosphate synthase
MRYPRLGGCGLEVSALCLGAMGFGAPDRGTHPWTVDGSAAEAIVRRAVELGVTFFDTANTYSAGASEEVLGRALRKYADRDEIVLASKVGLPTGPGPNRRGLSRVVVLRELDASLRRLGVDHLDLYQIHRFDPHTRPIETLTALDDAVRAGKVRYLGASSMPAWRFAGLQHTAAAAGLTPFVGMQSHYNLLYREEEREMIPLCLDSAVGVLPWSPLARGVLTRPWGSADDRSRNDEFQRVLYGPADRPLVDAVAAVAARTGMSMAQVSLVWLAGRPGVTAPIVGATETAHVEQACRALERTLGSADRALLDEAYVPHPVAGIDVLPYQNPADRRTA